MVQAEGARISISGTPPQGAPRDAARHPERGDIIREPASGYDRDIPMNDAPAMRRVRAPNPYSAYGYRYVGTMEGHNVYQAVPASGYAPGPLGYDVPD